MDRPNLNLRDSWAFPNGTSVHTSADPLPHISPMVGGHTIHVPYHGQTTLGMFDRSLPGHKLDDLGKLFDLHPDVFRKSGF